MKNKFKKIKDKLRTKKSIKNSHDYSYENFLSYLDRITNSKKNKQRVLNVYNQIVEADETLTKDDFQPVLIVNGNGYINKYEQDIIEDLFQGRDIIKLEEVFIYNIINYLDKIKFFFHLRSHVESGVYEFIQQQIMIENVLSQIVAYKLEPAKILEAKEIQLLEHELNHVLHLQTYNKGRYISFALSNVIFDRETNIGYSLKNGVIHLDKARIPFEDQINFDGRLFFHELFNEYYTSILNDSIFVLNRDSSYSESLYTKSSFETLCDDMPYKSVYNHNWSIVALMVAIFEEMDCIKSNYNFDKIIKKINDYHIDDYIKEQLVYELHRLGMNRVNNDDSNYELLMYAFGDINNLIYGKSGVQSPYLGEALKTNLQAFLLDMLKQKILNAKKSGYDLGTEENFLNKIQRIDNSILRAKKGKRATISETTFEKMLQETELKEQYEDYISQQPGKLTEAIMSL